MWNQTSRVSCQTTSPATFYVFVKVAAMPEISRKTNRQAVRDGKPRVHRAIIYRYGKFHERLDRRLRQDDSSILILSAINSKPPAESIGLRHARRDPDRDLKDARSQTRSGRTHGKVVLERRETSRLIYVNSQWWEKETSTRAKQGKKNRAYNISITK